MSLPEYSGSGHAPSKKFIETSTSLLGLGTPASRQQASSKFTPFLAASYSVENLTPAINPSSSAAVAVTPLDAQPSGNALMEGEILKGLNVNDPLLPSRRHLIQQLFTSIDHIDDLQVSSAALRIITLLSDLPQYETNPNLKAIAPNRLFSVLQEEPGLLARVLNLFKRRLEREETENIQFLADGRDYPHLLSAWILLNESNEAIEQFVSLDLIEAFGLTNLIRLQILNLFIRNVAKDSFNISHHLLGFDFESFGLLQTSTIRSDACLPLIVDMLRFGLGHESIEAPAVCIEHPSLGVRLFQLVKALLMSKLPNVSRTIREYLRNDSGLFLELAEKINGHLLQVSFSVDYGYSLAEGPSSRESSAANSLQFTIFELQQKAELFLILSLELFDAFQAGKDELYYLNKLLKALLSGDSKLIQFLAAIDDLSVGDGGGSAAGGDFEAAMNAELEAAYVSYVDSVVILIGKVLLVLQERDEQEEYRELGGRFISLLKAWLWKYLQKPGFNSIALECLLQLTISIATTSQHNKPKQLSGEELSAHISVLMKPEVSSSGRSFIYAALMKYDGNALQSGLSEDSFLRLVEIVICDVYSLTASRNGALINSLISVALSFLEFLHQNRSNFLESIILFQPGNLMEFADESTTTVFPSSSSYSSKSFLPTLLHSLLQDDELACDFILSSVAGGSGDEDSLSIFLKWRAKWSLLMNFLHVSDSKFAAEFIEGGYLESIIFRLRALTLSIAYKIGHGGFEGQLVISLLTPIYQFLAALSSTTGRQMAVASRLTNFFSTSPDALEALSVVLSTAPSSSNLQKNILILVNLTLRLGDTSTSLLLGDVARAKSTSISLRHAVYVRFSKASVVFEGATSRTTASSLEEEDVGILSKLMEFLLIDGEKSLLSPQFSQNAGNSSAVPSFGAISAILHGCVEVLRRSSHQVDWLSYLSGNLEIVALEDLFLLFKEANEGKSITLEDSSAIHERIMKISGEFSRLSLQTNNLFEQTLLVMVNNLRARLAPIISPHLTCSLDPRNSNVIAARSLRAEASIFLPNVVEMYLKLQLSPSPYMTKLASTLDSLLKPSSEGEFN